MHRKLQNAFGAYLYFKENKKLNFVILNIKIDIVIKNEI